MGRPSKRSRTAQQAFDEIRRENVLLENYYKQIFGSVLFNSTFQCLRTSLPACVRVCQSSPLWKCTLNEVRRICLDKDNVSISDSKDTKTAQNDDTLVLESRYTFKSSGTFENQNETKTGQPLLWFKPNNLAWQWDNLNRVGIKKDERFKQLKRFLVMETNRGALVRQEAASMIPPLYLNLSSDHLILDMCAAPGSKTSQIMDYLSFGSGGIIANEINIKRASMLTHQLSQLNLPSSVVTCFDASIFPTCSGIQFDRILADVPCSGDGTLRKQPDIWKSWIPSKSLSLHSKQISILTRGLELLKVNGYIVYSTCSMNPIENEAVINTILNRYNKSIELIPSKDLVKNLKIQPGLITWAVPNPSLSTHNNTTIESFKTYDDVPLDQRSILRPTMFPNLSLENNILQHCVRIIPQDNNTGAFFVAVIKKHRELVISSVDKEETEDSNEATNTTSNDEKQQQTLTVEKEEEQQQDTMSSFDSAGLHAHEFLHLPIDRQDIQQLKYFLGLHMSYPHNNKFQFLTNISCESNCNSHISVDKCDLRYLFNQPAMKEYQNYTLIPFYDQDPQQHITHSKFNPSIMNSFSVEDYQNKWNFFKLAHYEDNQQQHTSPLSFLFYRKHIEKRLYSVTPKVFEFVNSCPKNTKFVHLGVRVFEHLDAKQSERYEGTEWRLTQSGLPLLLPYMKRRIIFISLTIARSLLKEVKGVSGTQLLESEARGQILNLSSCRSPQSNGVSHLEPGSVAVIVCPPLLIPLNGYFPEQHDDILNCQERNISSPHLDMSKNETFQNGSWDVCVPIACLLTKSGTLLPYVSKLELEGLLYHLFGSTDDPTSTSTSDITTA